MIRKALIALATAFVLAGCASDKETLPGGNGQDANTFRVETSHITSSTVDVAVTPTQKQNIYVFGVMTKAQATAVKYDDAIVGSIIDDVENIMDVAVTGSQKKTFTGLKADTQYIAFAAGVSTDGKRTTDVTRVEFTTLLDGEGGDGGDDDDDDPGEGEGVFSETFAGYTGGVKSSYSAKESFTSTATGVTWTLLFGSIDQTEDHAAFYGGHCFTLGGKSGKADDGQSTLTSSTLKSGITRLAFDYIANKDKKLEVQVLVGDKVVWTSGSVTLTNNGTSDPKKPAHLSYNITGASSNAVLKFINVSSERRISIGNLTWTNATGQGGNGAFDDDGGGEGDDDDDDDDDDETTSLESDVTMTATSVLAEYYGDYYETSTNDWVLTMSNGNGETLMIELLTAASASNPVGTFAIDESDSCTQGTALFGFFDDEGYIYPTCYVNEKSGDYALIYGGSVLVSKSGSTYTIAASFTDAKGHKIQCNYTGTITIQEGEFDDDGGDDDDDDDEGDDDFDTTTLTGDVTVSGINYAGAVYYGNDLDTGTNDWIFYLGNDNEEICVELFSALSATTPEGTYTLDLEYTGAAGTMWDGCDLGYGIEPAYYNYDTDDYAYPASGTVTISNNGSTYTVAIALVDELGHKIKCDYTGAMEIGEGQYEEETPAPKTAKAAVGKATFKVSRITKYEKAHRGGVSRTSRHHSGMLAVIGK